MNQTLSPHALRVSDLAQNTATEFLVILKDADLRALAAHLDLLEVRKVRFAGTLKPLGKSDWQLNGTLGATVVQPCVATLAPVTTRIDTAVERLFLRDFVESDAPEAEMDEDDRAEALGSHIDPARVLEEALSLALPLYPRADGSDPVSLQVTEPGKDALTDEAVKPFAGLAALRDKMGGDAEE